jgi:DNA-binding MarR family transcriptional regulator
LFDPGGPVSAEALAELRDDPRFPKALRLLMGGFTAIYRGNRLLNMLINDRGRMVMGHLALYLNEGGAPDGRGRGFGVGQLKAAMAAAGLASPGRTGAMLALMRMSGYIASASSPDDKRRHILVPTEKLRTLHLDRWRHVQTSLREVRPDVADAFALDNPDFVAAYVRYVAREFLGGFRMIDVAPEMELIIDRNAGLLILISILLSGEDDDTFPPSRPVPVSLSALSQRFGVSRAHVRMLLKDAEAAGLIERSEDRLVTIKPHFAESIKTFFAAALLFTADCALKARAEADSAARSR